MTNGKAVPITEQLTPYQSAPTIFIQKWTSAHITRWTVTLDFIDMAAFQTQVLPELDDRQRRTDSLSATQKAQLLYLFARLLDNTQDARAVLQP